MTARAWDDGNSRDTRQSGWVRYVAVTAFLLAFCAACSSSGSDASAKPFAQKLCGAMLDWGQAVNGAGLEGSASLAYAGSPTTERTIQSGIVDRARSATSTLVQSLGNLGREQGRASAEVRLANALDRQFSTIAAGMTDIYNRWLALPVGTQAEYVQARKALIQEFNQLSHIPIPLSLLGSSKPSSSDRALASAFRSEPLCAGLLPVQR